MNEAVLAQLAHLGSEGINAYYLYLALDYGSLWVVIGLCTWGARGLFKVLKELES